MNRWPHQGEWKWSKPTTCSRFRTPGTTGTSGSHQEFCESHERSARLPGCTLMAQTKNRHSKTQQTTPRKHLNVSKVPSRAIVFFQRVFVCVLCLVPMIHRNVPVGSTYGDDCNGLQMNQTTPRAHVNQWPPGRMDMAHATDDRMSHGQPNPRRPCAPWNSRPPRTNATDLWTSLWRTGRYPGAHGKSTYS